MKTLLDCKDKDIEPMSEKTSEMFIRCMMAEMQEVDFPEEEAMQSLAFKIIKSRLEGADVSSWAILFLATICGRPAMAKMWAYACFLMARKQENKVTMSIIADYFPVGFPTARAMEECWDSQKDPNSPMSNYLDNPIAWTNSQGEEK